MNVLGISQCKTLNIFLSRRKDKELTNDLICKCERYRKLHDIITRIFFIPRSKIGHVILPCSLIGFCMNIRILAAHYHPQVNEVTPPPTPAEPVMLWINTTITWCLTSISWQKMMVDQNKEDFRNYL